MNIAALYTCHNRKEKTKESLKNLFKSLDYYNERNIIPMSISIYLTDDGSTDGTREEIYRQFNNRNITIINGDGNLFWSRGMNKAWKASLCSKTIYDGFLLLNDDTFIFEGCLQEIINTHKWCIEKYKKEGIYSGVTCSPNNKEETTYSGKKYTNKLLGHANRLAPIGVPQLADEVNANILYIPKSVVNILGTFYNGFHHGSADFDYSMRANKKGIPVLITAKYCGCCERDHQNIKENTEMLKNMSLKQRIEYFKNPRHSYHDYLLYLRRNIPLKYPFSLFTMIIREYLPNLFYLVLKRRNII